MFDTTNGGLDSISTGNGPGSSPASHPSDSGAPGSWAKLPPDLQHTFIENTPTFLDEARDPEQLAFDLAWIKAFPHPSLLTTGDQSPPIFAPVVAKLAEALPNVEVITYSGAGHIPYATHPAAYVDAITTFIRKNST